MPLRFRSRRSPLNVGNSAVANSQRQDDHRRSNLLRGCKPLQQHRADDTGGQNITLGGTRERRQQRAHGVESSRSTPPVRPRSATWSAPFPDRFAHRDDRRSRDAREEHHGQGNGRRASDQSAAAVNDNLTVNNGTTSIQRSNVSLQAANTLTLAAGSSLVAASGAVNLTLGNLAHGGHRLRAGADPADRRHRGHGQRQQRQRYAYRGPLHRQPACEEAEIRTASPGNDTLYIRATTQPASTASMRLQEPCCAAAPPVFRPTSRSCMPT